MQFAEGLIFWNSGLPFDPVAFAPGNSFNGQTSAAPNASFDGSVDRAYFITTDQGPGNSAATGFLVGVAKGLTAGSTEYQSAFNQLCAAEQQLERARLARQDTLCREPMPEAQRHWLEANRSPLARHWNLLTGLTADQLWYVR